MKTLKKSLEESLIASYDTDKLKAAITKKYGITEFHDHVSKSDNPHRFVLSVNKEMYGKLNADTAFFKLADFYGYTFTEVTQYNGVYYIHLEPNFGKKCNNFVYDDCKGIIWHITDQENSKDIINDGITPFKGKSYRRFTERAFFCCGTTREEIVENIKATIKELGIKTYIVYKIDLSRHRQKPYNVNFYYDPSAIDCKNHIYANAVFFPHLIEKKFYNIADIEKDLSRVVTEAFGGTILHEIN